MTGYFRIARHPLAIRERCRDGRHELHSSRRRSYRPLEIQIYTGWALVFIPENRLRYSCLMWFRNHRVVILHY
jgi:hypothetical protein